MSNTALRAIRDHLLPGALSVAALALGLVGILS